DRGIALRRDQGAAAAQAHVNSGEGKTLMDDVLRITREMETEERSLLDERSAAADASARMAGLVTLWGTLIALIIASVAGFVIVRGITGPLRELTEAANRITVGDLGAQLPTRERQDEVG